MIFEISEKANEDLENIWLYTYENWSQEQADRYYNLILNEIEYITENFESGKSFEHIRKGYRSTKVKSHLIFYRKSKRDTIEIIRILHQRMDIENRLNE
ncbi:type II toxin-antitoxin system RelE/ParE family toxin [Kaistella jeonii]|uniref:Toxin n=1 Tax=Kaistella jeonii TaxID=266749 RepID=A0A0C1FD02_9FLAO|nr:type II toxin-antitoxin system RelE/ParE family toxin [Kaistella jeonii]KIA89703.1 plasmid stabilization protein [Kaistella jeonii]SFB88065.1 toxin ParE1/3/4 [Kaistella jeonii]VEI95926.1 Toxin ParE1 [Kaistella jeonii]